MTGYIAAALRCFFDPGDLRCLDFCDTFHVEFVATAKKNQRSSGEVAEHAYSAGASCAAAMVASAVARASFTFSNSTSADVCTADSTSASG